jgi:hypothetical protein
MTICEQKQTQYDTKNYTENDTHVLPVRIQQQRNWMHSDLEVIGECTTLNNHLSIKENTYDP